MLHRQRPRIKQPHNNHVHRWTVSYADYMTLMFALFVVLYAVLLNKKEDYQAVLNSIQEAGQFITKKPAVSQTPVQNALKKEQGEFNQTGVLDNALLTDENKQASERELSTQTGLQVDPENHQQQTIFTLKSALENAFKKQIAAETFNIQLDEQWLTIEMTGPLLFAAGSHTLLNGAKRNIKAIAEALKPVKNMIRLRGYTDPVLISNELYQSNWELSALRAISVLHALNKDGIKAGRMAVEAYAQYQPVLNAKGQVEPLKSRRVVIAISRFALFVAPKSDNNINVKIKEKEKTPQATKPDSEEVREMYLPDGRLIITTRQE